MKKGENKISSFSKKPRKPKRRSVFRIRTLEMLNGSFYFFLSVTLFLLDPISTISLSSEVNSCKLNSHADYFSFSREKERERE